MIIPFTIAYKRLLEGFGKMDSITFDIPPELDGLFTPGEIEEVADLFEEIDTDGSGLIDLAELTEAFAKLGEDHLGAGDVEELMTEADANASGAIDFGEFLQILWRLKQSGKSKFSAFSKMFETLNDTPNAVLQAECERRHLKLSFVLQEIQEATSSHGRLFVMEVRISGRWTEVSQSKVSSVVETRRFQGIGKNTREAKTNASITALSRMKKFLPGIDYAPGEIPFQWKRWFEHNIDRGVDELKLLRILQSKGFFPTKNLALMQKLSLRVSIRKLREELPSVYPRLSGSVLPVEWVRWTKEQLQRGFDGKVLLETLADNGFDPEKQPQFSQSLCQSLGGRIVDKVRPLAFDFWSCAATGEVRELLRYVAGGHDLDEPRLEKNMEVTALTLAIRNSQVEAVRVLTDNGAAINATDIYGRSSGHTAARAGNVEIIRLLISHGADFTTPDHYGDTPLHIAASHSNYEAMRFILEWQNERTRRLLSGRDAWLVSGKRLTFEAAVKKLHGEYLVQRLSPYATALFDKSWIYDAIKAIHTSYARLALDAPMSYLNSDNSDEPRSGLDTSNVIEFVEFVDPKKVCTIACPSIPVINAVIALYDRNVLEDHVDLEQLTFLLGRCFAEAYTNNRNKIGNTPLTAACASCARGVNQDQKKIIHILLDEFGCETRVKNNAGVDAYAMIEQKLTGVSAEHSAKLESYNQMIQAEHAEDSLAREPLLEDRLYKLLRDSGDVLKQWRSMHAQSVPTLEVGSYQEFHYEGDVFYFNKSSGEFQWNRPREIIDRLQEEYAWYLFRRESFRVRMIFPWEAYLHGPTGQLFYVHYDTREVTFDTDTPLPCEPLHLLLRRNGWQSLRARAKEVSKEGGWDRFVDAVTQRDILYNENLHVGKFIGDQNSAEQSPNEGNVEEEASSDLRTWRRLPVHDLETLGHQEVIDEYIRRALKEGSPALVPATAPDGLTTPWRKIDVVDSFSHLFQNPLTKEISWTWPGASNLPNLDGVKLSFQRVNGEWEEHRIIGGGPLIYLHEDSHKVLLKPKEFIARDRENAMWALRRIGSQCVCTLGHWTKWSTPIDLPLEPSGEEDVILPTRQVFFFNKDEDLCQWERPAAWSSLVDNSDLVAKGGRENWLEMKLCSDELLPYQWPDTPWQALQEPNTGATFYWNRLDRTGSWEKPTAICVLEQKKLLYNSLMNRSNGRKAKNLQVLRKQEVGDGAGTWHEEIDRFPSRETKVGTVLCLYYLYQDSSHRFGLAHNCQPTAVFPDLDHRSADAEHGVISQDTREEEIKHSAADVRLSEEDRTKFAEDLLKVSMWIEASQERAAQGFVLCWWGCKTWIEPENAKSHQQEHCIKRLVPCPFACPLVLRVEQWAQCKERHTTLECPKRKVPCDNLCGEEIVFEEMEEHLTGHCIKRPAPSITCSLGCGWRVDGGIEDEALMKWEAVQHEENSCPKRRVRCDWKGCAAEVTASELAQHRKYHLHSMGIFTWVTPGQYKWRVPLRCKKVLIQAWGAGGGGGFLQGRRYSTGGCGGFVQIEVQVFPHEELTIHVGAGGEAGSPGVPVEGSADAFTCGVAKGGHPGGGDGRSMNNVFACGGGGGFSAVYRQGPFGHELLLLAGGGGGAGSRPGQPGGALHPSSEPKPATAFQWEGGDGGPDVGGEGGIGGASNGSNLQGGQGADYGGGGGGGWFGGGGGGFTPGIAGGGGGGSSFVGDDKAGAKWLKVESGTSRVPGGMEADIPAAVGLGDWDVVGGPVGLGGLCEEERTGDGGVGVKLLGGNAGAVRVRIPGFYENSFVAKEEDLKKNVRAETPATVLTHGTISEFSDDQSSYRPPSAIVNQEAESSSDSSSEASSSSGSEGSDDESENLSMLLRQVDEEKNKEGESVAFAVGDRVMAHYEGIPSNPEYEATITAVHGNDTYDVLFDDGERSQLPISKFLIRPLDTA